MAFRTFGIHEGIEPVPVLSVASLRKPDWRGWGDGEDSRFRVRSFGRQVRREFKITISP